MNIYRDSTINIISFLISISIFFLSEFFVFYFSNPIIKFKANFNQSISQNVNLDIKNSINQETHIQENIIQEKIEDWYLEIPSIGLKANIAQGTSKETMEFYIGHFEETSNLIGNIGLAAHNRGYINNYFQNLKELKIGDEINYYYKGELKRYTVEEQKIIKDTDWTVLEETKENRITLITCVENEPSYRRCVRGKEI